MSTIGISVVSPIFGCRPCLGRLVDGVERACRGLGLPFELILVDDGSPDESWSVVQELLQGRPWLRGIRLSRNFGQHAAISTGIAAALGEWVVVMDCDLQDPPSGIPLLYHAALDGGHDVVFASRVNRQDAAFKRFTSWAFYRLLSWLTGVHQDATTANFGIFHRKVIDAVVAMPERDRAFPLLVRWVGFRQSTVGVEHAPRAAGDSSYTLGRMLRLASHIVLGYSSKPLRMVAGLGVASATVSFVLAGWAVYLYLTEQITVAGYTSVIASTFLVGGLTLFCLGVVGLYVGQVFVNVQGRPSSIVAESVQGTSEPTPPPAESRVTVP